MFVVKTVFSSFSVDNLAKTKAFYTNTLGLEVDDSDMGLMLRLPDGGVVFVYQKDNHEPATFTVLNFAVDDIDEAMDVLAEKGVTFEHYDSLMAPQDEKGVLRGLAANEGPDIAWFEDPAGNVLSLMQEK